MVRPDPSSFSSSLSTEASLLSCPDVDGVVEVTNKVVVAGLAVVVFDILAIICSPRLKNLLYLQSLLFSANKYVLCSLSVDQFLTFIYNTMNFAKDTIKGSGKQVVTLSPAALLPS